MDRWQIAIETSGRHGSVALLSGPRLIITQELDPQQRTAAVLASALAPLLERVEEANSSLGFVSVSQGPGSFTGLRIGVTTAKTLAYALQTPVVPVDTLAVIAGQVFAAAPEIEQVAVGLQAYRGQVYVRQEIRGHGALYGSQVWSSEKWKIFLHDIPKNCVVAGNADRLPLPRRNEDVSVPPWMPSAAGLGELAWQRFQRGEGVAPMQLTPHYLRPSAAEEKAAAESSSTAPRNTSS